MKLNRITASLTYIILSILSITVDAEEIPETTLEERISKSSSRYYLPYYANGSNPVNTIGLFPGISFDASEATITTEGFSITKVKDKPRFGAVVQNQIMTFQGKEYVSKIYSSKKSAESTEDINMSFTSMTSGNVAYKIIRKISWPPQYYPEIEFKYDSKLPESGIIAKTAEKYASLGCPTFRIYKTTSNSLFSTLQMTFKGDLIKIATGEISKAQNCIAVRGNEDILNDESFGIMKTVDLTKGDERGVVITLQLKDKSYGVFDASSMRIYIYDSYLASLDEKGNKYEAEKIGRRLNEQNPVMAPSPKL